jgi:AAA domain, putative AbiEii toxin, Type IV TA system
MPDYALHFAKSFHAATDLGSSTITVWPIHPKWNNFGYGFQAKMRIRKSDFLESKKSLELDLYVVPVPLGTSKRFNTWLESLLPNQSIYQPHDMGQKFFTIMQNEESYKQLVTWVDNDIQELDHILLPLRDIVYFRKCGLEAEAIRGFLREDAVIEGIFRSESTYLAWHRGWRILAGASHNLILDARQPFSFSAHLSGFSSSHSLDIKFDTPVPLIDRCHALIGRNGAGKSRLLRELIICLGKAATQSDAELFQKNGMAASMTAAISPEQTRFNRVLVLTWDSHSQLPSDVRMDAPFEYLHFQMSEMPIKNGNLANEVDVSVASSDQLTPLLLQMLRERVDENDDPWGNLRKTLKPIFDLNEIAVATRSESGTRTEWVKIGRIRIGSEQNKLSVLGRVIDSEDPALLSDDMLPIALSSGERMFLSFGIRCVARITKGSIVILDEPETHLHPNLISCFLSR